MTGCLLVVSCGLSWGNTAETNEFLIMFGCFVVVVVGWCLRVWSVWVVVVWFGGLFGVCG